MHDLNIHKRKCFRW